MIDHELNDFSSRTMPAMVAIYFGDFLLTFPRSGHAKQNLNPSNIK